MLVYKPREQNLNNQSINILSGEKLNPSALDCYTLHSITRKIENKAHLCFAHAGNTKGLLLSVAIGTLLK